MFSTVSGSSGAGSIFDNGDPGGGFTKGVYVCTEPKQMDRHDGASPLRNFCGHLSRIDIEGAAIDIYEDHFSTAIKYGIRCRNPGKRRHDDFISRANVQGGKGKV